MEYGESISYLTLKRGVDVISADGDRIGVVEHVLGDEKTGIFDGIVIDTKLGPGGTRFVDAPDVAECRERAVLLSVATADIERLPKPEPSPAVLEHHGVEDTEGKVQGRLRQAWDRLSGK